MDKSELRMNNITIDGVEYSLENLSDEAQNQLNNIRFVDDQILQKNNEIQIALTSKLAYTRALKLEIESSKI